MSRQRDVYEKLVDIMEAIIDQLGDERQEVGTNELARQALSLIEEMDWM